MKFTCRISWFTLALLMGLSIPSACIQAQEAVAHSPKADKLLYLGQTPPGSTPEVFAAGLVSLPGRYEFGCSFSADATEFYYAVDHGGQNTIYQSTLENGAWTPAKPAFEQDSFSYNDPMLSPDENKLYYISNRPLTGTAPKADIDIWYSTRTATAWSRPVHAGHAINSEWNEYFCAFSKEGTIYFSSNVHAEQDAGYNFDIYAAEATQDGFAKPVRLNDHVNTDQYEADVVISPDGSYLIFCSTRKEGLGRGDLYISFRDEAGEWMPAQNMGPNINTSDHELCPFLSMDGKYLFFTSRKDIYWVSSEIIDSYR